MGTFQNFWTHIFGKPAPSSLPASEVVTHDPEASEPQDLDDPFFDKKVQQRMGVAIARAAQKKF